MFARRLPQAHHRGCYAQLDQHGICVALWDLQRRPAEGNWVRVTALNPHWIGAALPNHALQPTAERASISRWSLQHI